jgi:hypothetical protein
VDCLRVAELLAGLSLVADLGMGFEAGKAGRAAAVAMEIADVVDAASPRDVYYTALLQHIGCTAYAHETAALLGGDEIAVKRAAARTDFGDPREIMRSYLPHLAPTASLLTRVRVAGTAAVRARHVVQGYSLANCEVAARTADRLGLGEGVRAGLSDVSAESRGGFVAGTAQGLTETGGRPARRAQAGIGAMLCRQSFSRCVPCGFDEPGGIMATSTRSPTRNR